MTRVYLPLDRAGLALLRGPRLPAGATGFAATPALAAWWGDEEADAAPEEELELVAAELAAQASLALLGPAEGARLVAAVDVDAESDEAEQPGQVRVVGPVPVAALAAVLADDPAAADDVRAAVALLGGADEDDVEAAGRALDLVEPHDLAWYAPDEAAVLLAR